jgi:hypothetical protein
MVYLAESWSGGELTWWCGDNMVTWSPDEQREGLVHCPSSWWATQGCGDCAPSWCGALPVFLTCSVGTCCPARIPDVRNPEVWCTACLPGMHDVMIWCTTHLPGEQCGEMLFCMSSWHVTWSTWWATRRNAVLHVFLTCNVVYLVSNAGKCCSACLPDM